MTPMINPRGRLHELILMVGGHNFANQLEGELVIEWEYVDLGGIWRRSLKCTLHDSPNKPNNQTLSWEDNVDLWKEGTEVRVTLGTATIFQGRILSISAPSEEADYIGDWKISFEAGDALYYLNYYNRPMGNYAEVSLDGNKTLGEAVNTVLSYCGASLFNYSSLTEACNFNFVSRDQEGLITGMAGPLLYQQSQWVLWDDNTIIKAERENLNASPHVTIGINETIEYAPVPDPEPLVTELEMLTNAQSYIAYGDIETENPEDNGYKIDARVDQEGFVVMAGWVDENTYMEHSIEYRKGKSLAPEASPSDPYYSTIYHLGTVNVKKYNSERFLYQMINFSYGHLPMFFRSGFNLIPIDALSYYLGFSGYSPNPSMCWHYEVTNITINNNTKLVTQEETIRHEYLSENFIARGSRDLSDLPLINVNGTGFYIYGPVETDKQKRIIKQNGPRWFAIDMVYDFLRNVWFANKPQISETPFEPEIGPNIKLNRVTNFRTVYQLFTVELTATAPLSDGQPNPNQTEKELITVDFVGNQSKLNTLCNHYAILRRGRRRMWKITVPYSTVLYNHIRLPGRVVAWSPDAHARQLKYLVVGASIRLTEKESLIDFKLLYLGTV